MNIVAITALVVLFGSTASAFLWLESLTATRDCLWTHWYSDGRCFRIGNITNNIYSLTKHRQMIPAKNGGKNCTGDSKEYLPCSELEYIATTFYSTLASATSDVVGDDGQKRKLPVGAKDPDEPVTCVKPHLDASGNVRMAGKPCPIGRAKREVDVVDAMKMNANRVKRNVGAMKHRDVLFLIDEGSSVGEGFPKFLRLAKALINSFCGSISVSKDGTRIGILTFDEVQHPRLNFDRYFERADIINHIDDNINFTNKTSGKTCLVDALTYTRDEMLTESRGARTGVAGTERVVVLMTDGCANCRNQGDLPTALLQMSKQFSKERIPFITFFVGSDPSCVTTMSSLADGSQCYQVFRALDYDELDKISAAIERSVCTDSWQVGPTCPA